MLDILFNIIILKQAVLEYRAPERLLLIIHVPRLKFEQCFMIL
ncbi:hypothetical protein CSB68_4203 (plasmid) [Acinetobacter baumannii]|nr:hypothetical protein CSB68_4203 [Acinetobacter baumannii]